ncbi:MAG: hypothetical protein GKS01_14005 [Alphaproteobacteria bacterium]|nr:hypothetical protein [Alphaproteobacteria bacterium]
MSESSNWSLRGVTPEARAAVKTCAEAEGVSIGTWISGAIREMHAAEQLQPTNNSQDMPLPQIARKSSIERAMMRAATGNA